MKNEYIELFDEIKPSNELKNKVLDSVEKKKRISFSSKKFFAVAAAFALILAGGFGIYRASNDNVIGNDNTSQNNLVANALDFSIIAYADDSVSNAQVINDDDVTLMNIKFTLDKDNGEYTLCASSEDNGLSVQSDYEIESVIFESENGSFSYLDNPLKNYLIEQKKFYSAVIPLTKEQYDEYNNTLSSLEGENSERYKEEFVEELLNNSNYSEYVYDEDFDISKILTSEYSVDSSDMAQADENYYEYCILIMDKARTSSVVHHDEKELKAKTYHASDKIEGVYYYPGAAAEYLINNPETDFEDLPTDTITITVKFKNGQSATKEIITEFNSDGVLTMKCK